MSWAAIVSGTARQSSTSSTSSANATPLSNGIAPPLTMRSASASQLASIPSDSMLSHDASTVNSSNSGPVPQSLTSSPASSSENTSPSSSTVPSASNSPRQKSTLLLPHPSSGSRTPHSPAANSGGIPFRSRSHSNGNSNNHGNLIHTQNQNHNYHNHNYNQHHHHYHHHYHHHHHKNKQKPFGKKNNHSQTHNSSYNNSNPQQNQHQLQHNSDNYNQKYPESPNHARTHFRYQQQSMSPLTSPKAAKPKNNQAMWDDPCIVNAYRLWTHHISFFMAQPSHFFGVFVTNPVFRQSVFAAGLTFHPDTDPSHPVLINLNSSRFGMAERISVLSPPAGLDIYSTAVPSSNAISLAAVPKTTAAMLPSSMALPTSPHAVNPIQPLPAPLYLTPQIGTYYNATATSPMVNGEHSTIVIDGYTVQPMYTDAADNFTTSELSPRAEDMVLSRVVEMKIDASDTESERFSDGDHAYTNGIMYMGGMQQSFSYNALHNAHRTEPVRDGRRKVVSRVLNIHIPPSPICKEQSDTAKVELNEQIESLFPTITQPPDYPSVRDDLLSRLRAIISREWEGARINVYGSAGNGLGLHSADVDMSLNVPNAVTALHGCESGKNESSKIILSRLAIIMERSGMTILSQFLDARVPVIKMYDSISKLQVDVCMNNNLAVLNTQLLRAYVDLDERFRYVCILVKYWAKRRDLNDTYHGTLSSYGYTLLVIHYLQTLDPPVLPCLQRMVNGKEVKSDDKIPREMTDNGESKLYNTYFDRSVTSKTYESKNTDPVHELLLGFFHYFAYVFCYRTDLASIRLGKRTSRSERAWDEQTVNENGEVIENSQQTGAETMVGEHQAAACGTTNDSTSRNEEKIDQDGGKLENENKDSFDKRERMDHYPRRPRLASKHLFCIEDPFDIDHDLSRGMEKAAVTVIRQEMMRAYEIIAETGDFISACEEYG